MKFLTEHITTQNKTRRSRFTRMCIGEAVIELMKTAEYENIKISDIARRSGISRMTFYHYYDSKLAALTDYLDEIILLYLKESRKNPDVGRFQEYSHILFSLNFFDQYADYFLVMAQAGLYSVLINGINEFMTSRFTSGFKSSLYGLYYYAGALLNTFLKWEEGGKQEPAERIAEIISRSLPAGIKGPAGINVDKPFPVNYTY